MSNPAQAEIKMFGTTIEAMEAAKPGGYSNGLYAMAILSDVQEVLHRLSETSMEPSRLTALTLRSDLERSRQWINKAKFFIAHENYKEVKFK